MVESFELQHLSDKPQKTGPSAATINTDDADGTITGWSLATFALLLVLAGLLVVSPRLLIFMTGESRTLLTPLEAFLAFQFGILLFLVSVAVLVNAPSSALYTIHDTDGPHRRQLSHPLLIPMTGASLLMSLSAYNTTGIGMLSATFSTITGIVGLWGLWTIIFAGSGRRSKLGADKRTSAFIFGNKSAASEIKKNAKKQS
ncbi:hypothetical protein BJ322DRAFT_1027832 [Thelephora terrestris]|uniref:Uncharacterized protein n=1 Tax=Thelephora terrestris TaxID=56493 RepID=A0A9P6HPB3_9AGAM|nr:hypothetical protein BJ322DRAFT_1027832 [Thelephora terrestris]